MSACTINSERCFIGNQVGVSLLISVSDILHLSKVNFWPFATSFPIPAALHVAGQNTRRFSYLGCPRNVV